MPCIQAGSCACLSPQTPSAAYRNACRPTSAHPSLQPPQSPLLIEAGGRTWLAPTSLEELVQACTAHQAAGNDAPAPLPRFLAGNTGSGGLGGAAAGGPWGGARHAAAGVSSCGWRCLLDSGIFWKLA